MGLFNKKQSSLPAVTIQAPKTAETAQFSMSDMFSAPSEQSYTSANLFASKPAVASIISLINSDPLSKFITFGVSRIIFATGFCFGDISEDNRTDEFQTKWNEVCSTNLKLTQNELINFGGIFNAFGECLVLLETEFVKKSDSNWALPMKPSEMITNIKVSYPTLGYTLVKSENDTRFTPYNYYFNVTRDRLNYVNTSIIVHPSRVIFATSSLDETKSTGIMHNSFNYIMMLREFYTNYRDYLKLYSDPAVFVRTLGLGGTAGLKSYCTQVKTLIDAKTNRFIPFPVEDGEILGNPPSALNSVVEIFDRLYEHISFGVGFNIKKLMNGEIDAMMALLLNQIAITYCGFLEELYKVVMTHNLNAGDSYTKVKCTFNIDKVLSSEKQAIADERHAREVNLYGGICTKDELRDMYLGLEPLTDGSGGQTLADSMKPTGNTDSTSLSHIKSGSQYKEGNKNGTRVEEKGGLKNEN
jgi:hypothetical protein